MPDENQAMIEALKRDRHFVIVTEWRSKVDVSRGAPVIEKESDSPGVRKRFSYVDKMASLHRVNLSKRPGA